MNDRDELTTALAMLAAALRRHYGVTAMEVRVYVAERPGRPTFVLPFPPATPPSSSAEPGAEKLSATARRMLRAVAGLDEENPTAQEIAAAAKLPNEPHFRKLLSALRQSGFLTGHKGDAGYGLTPMALAALEPEE